MRRLHRHFRHPLADSDAGTSLVEIIVAIAIFAVVTGLFTASFLELNKGVRKQNSEVDTQAAVRTAFDLLDTQVRYADQVNTPTVANGSQYVEWQSGDASGSQICTQWQATTAAGTLQYRQWTIPSGGGIATTPPWIPVLTGLNPTTTVFSTTASVTSASNPVHQELLVTLDDMAGSPASHTNNQSLFTATNTPSATAPTTPICQNLSNPRP